MSCPVPGDLPPISHIDDLTVVEMFRLATQAGARDAYTPRVPLPPPARLLNRYRELLNACGCGLPRCELGRRNDFRDHLPRAAASPTKPSDAYVIHTVRASPRGLQIVGAEVAVRTRRTIGSPCMSVPMSVIALSFDGSGHSGDRCRG